MMDHVLNKITPFLPDDHPFIQTIAYRGGKGVIETGSAEILDELRVMIRGERTSAYATFCAHARPVGQTLRVYGTKNTAHVDYTARTVVLERKQAFPSALGRLFPPFLTAKDYLRQGLKNVNRFSHSRFHFFDGMRRLLEEFYLSIDQDLEPPIAYAEILRVTAMMESIFEQVYPEVRP
jgi:predicted dehydrogenase